MADPYDFIAQQEGFRPKAYWDNKQWSIGYGTKASGPDETIDQNEARRRLQFDADKAGSYVDKRFPGLDPNKRAALTSFTYNLGPGWMDQGRLSSAVQAGDWNTAANVMREYHNANGQPNAGLMARRQRESEMFLGAAPSTQSPTAFTPTGRSMPYDDQTGRWIPEDEIKANRAFGSQMWQLGENAPGSKYSGIVGALRGLGLTTGDALANNATRSNQGMQTRALQGLAGAKDANTLASMLINSQVPGLANQGVGVMAHTFEKKADREAQEAQQMRVFEFQKKLQQELSKQEMQQNLEMLRAMGVMPQGGAVPGATPRPPAPATSPTMTTSPTMMGPAMAGMGMAPKQAPGAINPIVPPPKTAANSGDPFIDDMLGAEDQRKSLSPQQKAGIALVMKEKGKAVDFLTEKGEKLTEGQVKDASFAERILRSEVGLREVVPTNTKGEFMKYDPTKSVYRFMPDWNVTNSPEWQKYQRNAREGIAAILRKDTGAAVTDQEWAWYYPMYYPQPGDEASVVQDKQQARIALARGLRNGSGPAFDQMFPRFNDQFRQKLTAAGADLTPKPSVERAEASAEPAAAPKSSAQLKAAPVGTIETLDMGGEPVRMKKRADGKWEKVGIGEEAGLAVKGIGQDIANSPAADFLRWLESNIRQGRGKPAPPSPIAEGP